MFDEIQKVCREEAARIAAKGYKTAEVTVHVNKDAITWVWRASVSEFNYTSMKTCPTLDDLHDKISDLPDAIYAAKAAVAEEYTKLQARAAELGVPL